jgi:hypothetical protein
MPEEYITYEAIWHTVSDERTCPKCRELDGQTWNFLKLEGVLEHPFFGPVYNLDTDLPLTHPNCRCILEIIPQIDLDRSEVFQEAKSMLDGFGYMPSNIDEATNQVQKLRVNMGEATGQARELEYILYRTTSMLSRLGLPPPIADGIQKIERMIMIVRMLHSTMVYFELGTPMGWVLGIIGGMSAAISASDLMLSLS